MVPLNVSAIEEALQPGPAGRGKSLGRLAADLFAGLLVAGALAGIAGGLSRWTWLLTHGVGTLTLAIVAGIVLGNLVPGRRLTGFAAVNGPGLAFARQSLLRAGIMLYGLHLTVQDIERVGIRGVAIDALVLISTFLLAVAIGTRWLGLNRRLAMLIGAGSAICGAAAVMATGPVVRARAEQVSVAVATVVAFGTVSMFLYPLLFTLNSHWHVIGGGGAGFGIYAGSTIHEVAQVVVAAHSIEAPAADMAVIAKMVRVTMLAPFLMFLAGWLARGRGRPGGRCVPAYPPGGLHGSVPWFALGFIGVVLLNSFVPIPSGVRALFLEIDTALLAMAMAALGVGTHLRSVREAGRGRWRLRCSCSPGSSPAAP